MDLSEEEDDFAEEQLFQQAQQLNSSRAAEVPRQPAVPAFDGGGPSPQWQNFETVFTNAKAGRYQVHLVLLKTLPSRRHSRLRLVMRLS